MLKMMHVPDSTPKCNLVPFIRKYLKRVHMTLSLRKTRQQVSRSPYHAQTTPSHSPHGDQPESQGYSKLSDMHPSASIFPHEKLRVLTDNVYTISYVV